MIEEPSAVKNYKEIQDAALGSLRDLASELQERLRGSLKYRMVSQSQAAPVEKAYFLWNKSGGTSAQPAFDAASTRAAIYIGDSHDRSALVTEVAEAASKEFDGHLMVVAAGQEAAN